MHRRDSSTSGASSTSNTARPATSSGAGGGSRHVTFVAHEPRPPASPATPKAPQPKPAYIPRNPTGDYPIVNTKLLRQQQENPQSPQQQQQQQQNARSPMSPLGNPYGVPLAALTGKQRAIMQSAQEMHEQRIEAYNSLKFRIQGIQQGLQVADTTLHGDMDSSSEPETSAKRRLAIDDMLSRREAIKEILEATNKCAARRPPGLESSSSSSGSSGDDSSDDDRLDLKSDDQPAGGLFSEEDASSSAKSHSNGNKAPRPTLLQNVQTKASDGVDLELVTGAMRSASKHQRKQHRLARAAAADDDDNAAIRSDNDSSDEGVRGVESDDDDEEDLLAANSFIRGGESLMSQLNVIRGTSTIGIDLDQGDDGESETESRSQRQQQQHSGDDGASSIVSGSQHGGGGGGTKPHANNNNNKDDDGQRTDIGGLTVDEVMHRFTQPVQHALDFYATSTDRVERDIKRMDPPLRLEQAQGKFFVVGRQYADVASRMIRAIDACRAGAEHCLKLLQPSLKLKPPRGVAELQMLQEQMVATATAAAASKKKSKRGAGGADESAAPAAATAMSTLVSPEQHAAEIDRLMTEEKERLHEFRILSKQLVGIVGGLNRVDQDARDLLDDLSNRDTQMASERSKMNVAKEECTSVITTRDDIKSELWLHRASNRMRQAVRRKAERIREKKAAAAALLAGGAMSAEEEAAKQRREAEESMESIAHRSRHPIPYGVGAPAMATIGGGRIAGPMTVVCVALDRYAEMWGAAPAAATKTLQMFREAVHASLWYVARVAVDAAKRRSYEEARLEAIKKFTDANEQFTDEDEKSVRPKMMAPIVDIFFQTVVRSTVSGGALLAATSAAAVGAASSAASSSADKKPKSLSPLEWARRSGHIAGGHTATAATTTGVDGTPTTTGVVSGDLYAEDHDAAIAASVRRKRGEKAPKTLRTPLFFSHEPFPFRCLLGPPAAADQATARLMEKHTQKLHRAGVGGGSRGYSRSGEANLAASATYMNLGPPPVCLIAEGDGAMPGSGDGGYYMVGFSDPNVAVKWACGLQLLLSQLPWTEALLSAEIASSRAPGGRERIYPQLQRFDAAVRDRMAAAEAQLGGATTSAATASAAQFGAATSSVGGTSPATTTTTTTGAAAAAAAASSSAQNRSQASSYQNTTTTAQAGATQIEEDAAFIAYSRRFGLQQEESGGPGSAEFDADPWKGMAILLSRQWGFGDQRFPGALFRGPLVRIGAHTGALPFDEVRGTAPQKVAPFFFDPVRRCATIPTGVTCARASWLCHAARGGETLVSDELLQEVEETVRREAIFNRRVPLPAVGRDFFTNKVAATTETARVDIFEPDEGSPKNRGRRGGRRSSRSPTTLSRRSSFSLGGGDQQQQQNKGNTGPGGHHLASNALASMTDNSEQCAVQLFPPMLLERGMVLGAPSSLTARTSSFIARVTCYNPNWWVWVNTTPQPAVVRQADLVALMPPPSSSSATSKSTAATVSNKNNRNSKGAAAAAAAVHAAANAHPPVLEVVGWTHGETIQLQRQELTRCALLVEGSKRTAAAALRQQRQAMDVSAVHEQQMMMQSDMTPFHEAVGILRTAGAESFRGFTAWLAKWSKAMENDIKPPVMQIVPSLPESSTTTAAGGGSGGGLTSPSASLRRSMSISGSFRYGSFAGGGGSRKNDFEAANTVTPYVLSNVVLQLVAHRIKVIKEQQQRQNSSFVSLEDLMGDGKSSHVEDESDFVRWWLKMESEAPNAHSGFVMQLLCRAVDGLYEECFKIITEHIDVASSVYGANAPLVIKTADGAGDNNNASGTFDSSSSSAHQQQQQQQQQPPLTQRPEHLHQKFCSEILKCVRNLDETFRLPALLLPSRAVCVFAATRPHNYALNPPNIHDWNSFATDFVSSKWHTFISDFHLVYPWMSPSAVVVSDAISMQSNSNTRWVIPPAAWCRKKLSTNSGGGTGAPMPLQVVPYADLMDSLREQCIKMWVPFSVKESGTSFHMGAFSVSSPSVAASVSFATPGLQQQQQRHLSKSSAAFGESSAATIQDVFGAFLQSSVDQAQLHADHRDALAAALNAGVPTMFEFAPYDVAGFDFATCQNTHKINVSEMQKKDSCPMRWWNPIRHSSSRMAQFSVVELRWPALSSRVILVQLAAALEFIKRKTQAHHDATGGGGGGSSGADAVPGGGAGMNFSSSFIFDDRHQQQQQQHHLRHESSSAALAATAASLRGGSHPSINSQSATPGLNWDQLLHPVLGVGIDFDPSRDGGVGRVTIVQPSGHTLHDRLMKDFANPSYSIFNNATLYSRRKRELLRIAMALAQLHEYGLFHGDLRPDNIYCEEEVGAGDAANARVRFRLANMPLVPQLVVSALCSPRPLLRVVPEAVLDAARRKHRKSVLVRESSFGSGGSGDYTDGGGGGGDKKEEDEEQDVEKKKQPAVEGEKDEEGEESAAVKKLRRFGLPDDDTEDHKWSYVAPELLLHIARGANPSKQITVQELAQADMFSFGSLLLTAMSGGYDHPFTNLEQNLDLEAEQEAVEREYAAAAAAAEAEASHDADSKNQQQQQQQQQQKQHDDDDNEAEPKQEDDGLTAEASASVSSSPLASSRAITLGEGGGDQHQKQQQQQQQSQRGPLTAAEKEQMTKDKAEMLERRLVHAAAASAYQVVHRASENADRLFMVNPLKWLRYTIFNSLDKVRSEPTLQDSLAERRKQMKEDEDLLERKKSGANSFATAIKRLVSRAKKGGTLKIGRRAEDAERAIAGLLLTDLVSKLLVSNPKERLTAVQVCQHPFFADVMVSSATSLPIPSTSCVFDMHPVPSKSDDGMDSKVHTAASFYGDHKTQQQQQQQHSSSPSPSGSVIFNRTASLAAAALNASSSMNDVARTTSSSPDAQQQQQQQQQIPSVPLTHDSLLASLNPVSGDEEGAATLRGFFKSAELALLRMRSGGSSGGGGAMNLGGIASTDGSSGLTSGSGAKNAASSGRYFGTSSGEAGSAPVRWTVSLDDTLTELPGRKPHHLAPRLGGGGDGSSVGFLDDSGTSSESEDEEDDDDQQMQQQQQRRGKRKRAQPRPLHFDVRISPSTTETMWRAWRHQRKTASAMLDSKMENVLRKAYDLREFAGM